MQQVQLFIKDADGQYQRIDLFKDETISLTQTLQNVKDIAKVFTDFTKSFSVPASKANNKLFKHYYNFDIVGGFDARLKTDGLIKLNGLDFKTGKIKLEGVDLKDNKPHTYRITFFGNLVNLKDLIGEDKLNDLSFLDNFTEVYSAAKIKKYLEIGKYVVVNGEAFTNVLITPLITHTGRLYYDSSSGHTSDDADSNNLYWHTSSTSHVHGVFWNDLKYAIRVYAILRAIEEEYSINFSNDFFHSSNSLLDNLYLWLHRKKGKVQSNPEGKDVFVKTLQNEGSNVFPVVTYTDANSVKMEVNYYATEGLFKQFITNPISVDYGTKYKVSITMPSAYNSQKYDLVIRRNGVIHYRHANLVNAQTNLDDGTPTDSLLGNLNYGASDWSFEIESGDSFIFTITVEASVRSYNSATGSYTIHQTGSTTISNVTLIPQLDFVPTQQVPEMKVIDFLTGLFKTFNLTAYVENDGTIKVQTLNDFYTSTNAYDITEFVDVNSSQVNVALPYKEINFKYKGNNTFLSATYNQLFNKKFGQLEYKGGTQGNLLTDNWAGNIYKLEAPFEKMVFERLSDVAGTNTITVQYGYFTDDNQEPYIGSPLLFFAENVSTTTSISMRDSPTSDVEITKTWIPSNQKEYDDDTSQSLNYWAEASEWSGNTNLTSLFLTYYQNYVIDIFNEKRRLTKIKAFLPLKVLKRFTLADTFIVAGNKYKINSITTNLQSGESDIELLNEV